MAQEGEAQVTAFLRRLQILAVPVGLEIGQLPTLAGVEQILEGEHHLGKAIDGVGRIRGGDIGCGDPTHQADPGLKALQASGLTLQMGVA